MSPPVLETERLLLREHRAADFSAHAAIWRDPEVVGFLGGPQSEEESWRRFIGRFGMWQLMGYGYWAVEEKASGTFIGGIGFAHVKRGLPIDFGDAPEIGWTLARAAWGKGYAREAVAAAAAWADAALPAPLTWCLMDPRNAISRRVAEGAGYRQVTETEYKGAPSAIFTRRKPAAA